MAIRITDGRGENSRAALQGRLTAARRAHTVRPYAPICTLLLVRLRIGRTAGATAPAASGRPGPAYGRTVGRAASQGQLTAARRAHTVRPYAPILHASACQASDWAHGRGDNSRGFGQTRSGLWPRRRPCSLAGAVDSRPAGAHCAPLRAYPTRFCAAGRPRTAARRQRPRR